MISCLDNHTSCARLLLKDSRVNVNETDNEGVPPLVRAAANGHVDVIKWWIASGRDIDNTDAIGWALQKGKTDVANLLERFQSDPTKTRSEVRRELLGITGQSPVSVIRL